MQNVQNTTSLLVRVMIGKVENLARLITILWSIPVIQNDPGWRCRTWCANASAAIAADGEAVGLQCWIGSRSNRLRGGTLDKRLLRVALRPRRS